MAMPIWLATSTRPPPRCLAWSGSAAYVPSDQGNRHRHEAASRTTGSRWVPTGARSRRRCRSGPNTRSPRFPVTDAAEPAKIPDIPRDRSGPAPFLQCFQRSCRGILTKDDVRHIPADALQQHEHDQGSDEGGKHLTRRGTGESRAPFEPAQVSKPNFRETRQKPVAGLRVPLASNHVLSKLTAGVIRPSAGHPHRCECPAAGAALIPTRSERYSTGTFGFLVAKIHP